MQPMAGSPLSSCMLPSMMLFIRFCHLCTIDLPRLEYSGLELKCMDGKVQMLIIMAISWNSGKLVLWDATCPDPLPPPIYLASSDRK